MRKPETERYGWASIVLHWLGAVALVFSFTTGDPLEDLTGVERLSAYDNHVLWATILGIALIARVAWRIRGGFKRNPNQHVALRILARAVMIGFLISIVGAVVSGLLLPWTEGQPLEIGPPHHRIADAFPTRALRFHEWRAWPFQPYLDSASAPSFAGRAETPDHRPRRRIRRNLPALGRPGLDETLDSSRRPHDYRCAYLLGQLTASSIFRTFVARGKKLAFSGL